MGKSTAFHLRLLLVVSMVFPSVHVSREGWASEAADKATAREAASRAIELYRKEEHAEALDLMKRAQALFDAPVHLLYIARCERELGRWVEAAEGYRALGRRELPDDAPQQFKDAVADARNELGQLEPKIPKLVIDVEPADVEVTVLSIDSVTVPPAVIGMERLVNPGKHRVRIEADEYEPAEKEIDVPPEGTTTVSLALGPKLAASRVDESPVDAPELSDEPTKSNAARATEVMLGLRVGGAAPGGKLPAMAARPLSDTGTVPFSDTAGSGGEAEIRAGLKVPLDVWIIERWGFHAFVSGGQLAGHTVDLPNHPNLDGIDVQPSFANVGLAASVGAARDEFGGFFELAAMAHFLSFAYSAENAPCPGGGGASAKRVGNGTGLRMSGGVGIPVSHWGLLTPYVTLSAHTLRSVSFVPDACLRAWYQQSDVEVPAETQSISDTATHSFFGIGVGGEGFLSL